MVSEELVVQLSPEFPVPRQKIKIAIIDDNRDHLDSLATAFRRQGYEILTADTIRAGRELVERSKPQLVIMDVHLSDGDGLGLCQLLSDQVSTSDIPIIVLSGSEDPDIVRRARSAGCQFFLRKPFDPNALLLLAENTLTDRME